MEEKTVKVKVKNIMQSPLKLRLVANEVRGKGVEEALNILAFIQKKGRATIEKALLSGVANAKELYGVDKQDLVISSIMVGEDRTLYRSRFAAKGRVSRIHKRRANINLELKVK